MFRIYGPFTAFHIELFYRLDAFELLLFAENTSLAVRLSELSLILLNVEVLLLLFDSPSI